MEIFGGGILRIISSRSSAKVNFGISFYLMILASFCSAIGQVITKYLLNFADYWTIFSYIRIGTFFILIPIFYLYFKDLISTVKKHGKRVIIVVSFNEILSLGAVILSIIAASIGYITLVNALSAIQPFFVLILTIIISIFFPKILKEEIKKSAISQKLIAIVMMFAGAIWIS